MLQRHPGPTIADTPERGPLTTSGSTGNDESGSDPPARFPAAHQGRPSHDDAVSGFVVTVDRGRYTAGRRRHQPDAS